MKNAVSTALLALGTAAIVVASPVAARAADDVAIETPKAPVEAKKSDYLYDTNGKRVARVYDVLEDGSVRVFVGGALKTIPVDTLSRVDEKLVSGLTKAQINKIR